MGQDMDGVEGRRGWQSLKKWAVAGLERLGTLRESAGTLEWSCPWGPVGATVQ